MVRIFMLSQEYTMIPVGAYASFKWYVCVTKSSVSASRCTVCPTDVYGLFGVKFMSVPHSQTENDETKPGPSNCVFGGPDRLEKNLSPL